MKEVAKLLSIFKLATLTILASTHIPLNIAKASEKLLILDDAPQTHFALQPSLTANTNYFDNLPKEMIPLIISTYELGKAVYSLSKQWNSMCISQEVPLAVKIKEVTCCDDFTKFSSVTKLHLIGSAHSDMNPSCREWNHDQEITSLPFNGYPVMDLLDVSMLGNVRCLTLEGLHIVSLKGLEAIDSLSISNVPYLADLSPIGSVKKVGLHYLPAVSNIQALMNVKHLIVDGLYCLNDLPEIINCERFVLNAFSIQDVSALKKVKHLVLASSNEEIDVSGFENESLTLQGIAVIKNISKLGNIGHLTLCSLPSVKEEDLAIISRFPKVTAGFLVSSDDLLVQNVKNLTLITIDEISKPPAFLNISMN